MHIYIILSCEIQSSLRKKFKALKSIHHASAMKTLS